MHETTRHTPRLATPPHSNPPTRVIRADDLKTALDRVRATFGEDALVVETREVQTRGEDGMAPREIVEVVVADGMTPYAQFDPAPPEVPTQSAVSALEIRHRLERLQRIAERVQDMAERVDEWRVADAGHYPLGSMLAAHGCSDATLRQLSAQFQLASRGGEPSLTAARRHLSRILRGTGALRLEAMRGEHWFLGRAGVGKTSLALHLAARLKGAGRRVALIAVNPQHDGDVQRVKSAGEALGITSLAVHDESDMAQARAHVEGVEVVLVDTPCYLGPGLSVDPGERAHRHLVVSLGDERVALREQLRQVEDWSADTLAVTQMDLFPRPGRLVDLAMEVSRPLSFLQGRQEGALRVNLARGEALLQAVLGDMEETVQEAVARA